VVWKIEIYLILLLISIAIAGSNLFFGLIRTYYAKYAKRTYQGSVDYWTSWERRKFDVAAQVLKEMGIESPQDMKKLMKAIKKPENK